MTFYIFAWFLEQLLKDHFLRDALGVLSYPLWSTVLQCGARIPTHTLMLDRAVSGARFLTGGVFECDIAHRRSVACSSVYAV